MDVDDDCYWYLHVIIIMSKVETKGLVLGGWPTVTRLNYTHSYLLDSAPIKESMTKSCYTIDNIRIVPICHFDITVSDFINLCFEAFNNEPPE